MVSIKIFQNNDIKLCIDLYRRDFRFNRAPSFFNILSSLTTQITAKCSTRKGKYQLSFWN